MRGSHRKAQPGVSRPLFLPVLLFADFPDRGLYAVDNLAELLHLMKVAHSAGYQRVGGAFRAGQCLDGQWLTMILHR